MFLFECLHRELFFDIYFETHVCIGRVFHCFKDIEVMSSSYIWRVNLPCYTSFRVLPAAKKGHPKIRGTSLSSSISNMDFRPLRGRSTVNGQIFDRWEAGRPRRWTEVSTREQVSLSVDRSGRLGKNIEQRNFTRSAARSADVHTCIACTSVDWLGRPTEQFCSAAVDRAVDWSQAKLFFQGLIKEGNFW